MDKLYFTFKTLWETLTLKERAELLIEEYDAQCDFYDFEKVSFYYKDGDKFIGIDNRTGDCWVEEFDTELAVRCWIE